MSDPSTRVTAPHDPKGRLISIFVGAVLLPSLALSYVSIEFVPQLAKANKEMGFKRAANTLADIEKDLARAAQAKALEAAQAVGWERLLDGREHVIAVALESAGLDGHIFDTLHLEGASSPRRHWTPAEADRSQSPARHPRGARAPPRRAPRTRCRGSTRTGKVAGVLRFRFKPDYIREPADPRVLRARLPEPRPGDRRARRRPTTAASSTRRRPPPTASSRSSARWRRRPSAGSASPSATRTSPSSRTCAAGRWAPSPSSGSST